MDRVGRGPLIALVAFALAGVIFAGVSSYDFIAHLDRQVHSITCSIVPGVGARDAAGTSGCHAALMSPYSAVLRGATWGGIPISLPALAVFAFLLFLAVEALVGTADAARMRFLLLATLLPVLTSIVYFAIAVLKVGSICTLCAGIYGASLGCFVAALVARRQPSRAVGETPASPAGGRFMLWFLEGVVFVAVPVLVYLAAKPAYAGGGACGNLLHPEDKYGIRQRLTTVPGAPAALELVDPLCPACKGLDQRLGASGFKDRLNVEVVFFPLDKECNWMVSESVHPGACALSEALICAGPDLPQVLAWVFNHQDELRDLGKADANKPAARLREVFPRLASCAGSAETRNKLNRSLRWAVSNSLPVLTPQFFLAGQRVCPEDTDLGFDYVMGRLLAAPQPAAGGAR